MSNLTLWEPMNEIISLRQAMDQLFNDAYTRPMGISGVSTSPAIDLYQDNDNVVVKAALPGLKAEDVEISVTADVLNLRGEYKQESEQKDATYHIREQRYGSFERAIRLPVEVQTGKAKADFEDGILTITLPKAEAVKPKMISIKAK
ncbi:MAG: Hsp20/alpha crystallin family protein [Anaerolineaceae bacterium]|nr:Hsp20/alpha crystallin family protein [Anaerolineaceae bacterium]